MQLRPRRNSRRGRSRQAPWSKKPLRNGRNPCKEFPARRKGAKEDAKKPQLSSLLLLCAFARNLCGGSLFGAGEEHSRSEQRQQPDDQCRRRKRPPKTSRDRINKTTDQRQQHTRV